MSQTKQGSRNTQTILFHKIHNPPLGVIQLVKIIHAVKLPFGFPFCLDLCTVFRSSTRADSTGHESGHYKP
jgi:hypothetical protein